MDPEAHKIARHHLGDQLISIYRGGPYGDQWTVHVGSPSVGIPGGLYTAATPDEAARGAAARLRAAGWVPTHPRLEWRKAHGAHELRLCIDRHTQVLFSAEDHWKTGKDGQLLYNLSDIHDDATISLWECPAAEVSAYIAEWCAAHLPSLHLPPFPGASDAS